MPKFKTDGRKDGRTDRQTDRPCTLKVYYSWNTSHTERVSALWQIAFFSSDMIWAKIIWKAIQNLQKLWCLQKNIYRPRSGGDNVLGSVRPSVHPSALSRLNRLTYDLDIRYLVWPWPWPGWDFRSRSYVKGQGQMPNSGSRSKVGVQVTVVPRL